MQRETIKNTVKWLAQAIVAKMIADAIVKLWKK